MIDVKFIKKLVETKTRIEDISKKTRVQKYVCARYLAVVLCKDFIPKKQRTHVIMAKEFGFSDHSLCNHAHVTFNNNFEQKWFEKYKDLYISCAREISTINYLNKTCVS